MQANKRCSPVAGQTSHLRDTSIFFFPDLPFVSSSLVFHFRRSAPPSLAFGRTFSCTKRRDATPSREHRLLSSSSPLLYLTFSSLDSSALGVELVGLPYQHGDGSKLSREGARGERES